MKDCAQRSARDWRNSLQKMSPAQRQIWLNEASGDELRLLHQSWGIWAREKQLPPEGDWRVWLLLAGRGFGKTRAGTEIGLKFTADVGGNPLTLSYTQSNTSADGEDDGSGDKSADSYGLGYSAGPISFKVAVNNSSAEDSEGEETSDASNTGFGLGYKVSSALKFGVYQVSGEDGDTEYSETAASLTYTIAPGLTTNLAYLTADTDEGDDSTSYSSTTAYIKVAF